MTIRFPNKEISPHRDIKPLDSCFVSLSPDSNLKTSNENKVWEITRASADSPNFTASDKKRRASRQAPLLFPLVSKKSCLGRFDKSVLT